MTDKERIIKAHRDSGFQCELLLATKDEYPLHEETTHIFKVYPMSASNNTMAEDMYAEYEFDIDGNINSFTFYEK